MSIKDSKKKSCTLIGCIRMIHRIRDFDPTKPVEVYRNLNSGLLSVRQKNLICFYTEKIQLTNVKLVVREAGRESAVRTKRRNVHAFAKGYINEMELSFSSDRILYYNPFRVKGFVNETGQIVKEVNSVEIHANGRMFYN